MAIQSMQLDPNAASYTDDEIVGKVNAAAAAITRADAIDGAALGGCDLDDIGEGATNKHLTDTKDTKLTGIDAGAEVNPADLAALDAAADTKLGGIEAGADVNPTDDEIVAGINAATDPITREAALSQDDLKIVKTNPTTGKFQVKNIHRAADGKLDIEYDDVAES